MARLLAESKSNRHWSEKSLEDMQERDWKTFKEDFKIEVRGSGAPLPIRYWNEAKLPKPLLDTLRRLGHSTLTPIQRQGIPVGLANKDMVGISETSLGKSAAFVLPMLVHITKLPKMDQKVAKEGPYALVLAPTRQVAQAIADQTQELAAPLGIRSVCIVGGLSTEEQGAALRKGAEIMIATPGRLCDCIERQHVVLRQCSYVVLDETARMLDTGFEPQLLRIMDTMPSINMRPEDVEHEDESKVYRQTSIFSATLPEKVESLANKYLRNPIFITAGSKVLATDVNQEVLWVTSDQQKKTKIMEILLERSPPFIVFANSKRVCDALSKYIESQGIAATAVHGGKIQEEREINMKLFKDGTYDVLVATDAVGTDTVISGAEHLVNYDMPSKIEKYIHRLGCSRRSGKTAAVTSFLTPQDSDIMAALKDTLSQAGAKVPNELALHIRSKHKR